MSKQSTSIVRAPEKQERVLFAMLYCGALNGQEAEKPPICGRYINSEISTLKHRDGLAISGVNRPAKGYAGQACMLKCYSVEPDSLEQAKALIDQWRQRRNAKPVDWQNLKRLPLSTYLQAQADYPPAANDVA